MAIYKRGGVYWYEFSFKGERYRESTHQGNPNVARSIEHARRTALAKGEVGILDRPPAPTLKEFEKRFTEAIETKHADKPQTITFYKEKYRRLLEHAPFAAARLDQIDESMIDAYKNSRRRQLSRYKQLVSPASVNRELATLSRALRLALKWKVIIAVPAIGRLPGERNREFVLDHQLEARYLEACPEPLGAAAMLMLDTGIRVGEACSLSWADVALKPAIGARHGYLRIRKGKTKNAKRTLSLTPRVAALLQARKAGFEIGLGISGRLSGGAHPGDLARSPARYCAGAAGPLRGVRATFVTAYDADPSRRGRRRCFHDHEDRRP